jgi:short-subunit dehydrogenase
MSLAGKKILLTGATGGLGQALAIALAKQGAALALVGRDEAKLMALNHAIRLDAPQHCVILNDFSSPNSAQSVVNEAITGLGGLDIVINNAGCIAFTQFAEQDPQAIDRIMHVNSVVPMQMARAALPYFLNHNAGHIVNVGSMFGTIGFPHYAAYSASKFALRGFSQALGRELFDSPIAVTYVAPRAIKTAMNSGKAIQMLVATNTAMDSPEFVANRIIDAIVQQKETLYIGYPEKIFAWLNGCMPRLVSMGLKNTTAIARKYL